MDIILNAQSIGDKYERIMRHDTTNLLIETSYHTVDEFIISKRNSCDDNFNKTDEKQVYLKFLSYLEKYIKIYKNNVLLDMDNDKNCAYVHLSLLSSIPTINGYCFSFEKAMIHICDYCNDFFLDDLLQDNAENEDRSSNKFIKEFIKDYMRGAKILQIKNIDKQKKVKLLCDGNYFVLDQRILINESVDMRSDYEKLLDNNLIKIK